jgi:hydrogenase nickel incorporation protein HypB
MCAHCGCGATTAVSVDEQRSAHNDRVAARNRAWLAERRILALDLVSAPGAGKTTLLERTLAVVAGAPPVAVLEGDPGSDCDAARLRATGCAVRQIHGGAGCHVDAEMVASGLESLDLPARSWLFIENVGNLLCPSRFDLGERHKVVILSVTEGENQPLKYPHLFRAAAVLILNKIDLLPHLAFDVERCLAHVHRVNPRLRVFAASAARGDGIADWVGWLRAQTERRDAPHG